MIPASVGLVSLLPSFILHHPLLVAENMSPPFPLACVNVICMQLRCGSDSFLPRETDEYPLFL